MCPCKKMSWLSRLIVLLFSVLGLWYTLHPFGVPTVGEFWHWVMILFGVYTMVYCRTQSYEQTARLARWIGLVVFFVGSWFLVGEYFIRLMPVPLTILSTVGSAGSWLVIVLGAWMIISGFIRACSQPLWYSLVFTGIGVWFLLGDMRYVPTFGINLLHLMVFLLPIGIMMCCSSCHKSVAEPLQQSQSTPQLDENKHKLGAVQHLTDEDEWENL